MSTTNYVKKISEDRVALLRARNEELVKSIPFIAQRLEDYKTDLANNLKEIDALQDFLRQLPNPVQPEKEGNQ